MPDRSKRQKPATKDEPIQPTGSPEELEGELDEEERVIIQRVLRYLKYEFSGPLPHPRILEQYDEVLPGLAERIVTMAEKEQGHRHAMDRGIMGLFSRGQWFGFIMGIVTLLLGSWLLYEGRDLSGFGIVIVGIGSIIASLLFGRQKEKQQRESQ